MKGITAVGIVDGYWYFYPAPFTLIPDPYTPPTVVVETAPGALLERNLLLLHEPCRLLPLCAAMRHSLAARCLASAPNRKSL